MKTIVHLTHICIIGGLFLFVGICRNTTPQWMYSLLLAMGILVFVYHTYSAYKRWSLNKNPWVNFIHMFIVFPILTFIGYYRDTTPRYGYELLLMIGFASIGYHALYLLQ